MNDLSEDEKTASQEALTGDERSPTQISATERAKREGRFTRVLFVGGDSGRVSLLDAEHAPDEAYKQGRYAAWVIQQKCMLYSLGNWIELKHASTGYLALMQQLGIQPADKFIDGLYGIVYLLTEEQYQAVLAKEAELARKKEEAKDKARREIEEKKAAFFAQFKEPLSNPTLSELCKRAFTLKRYEVGCSDPREDCSVDEVSYLEFPFREDAENFAKLVGGSKEGDKVVIVQQHTY